MCCLEAIIKCQLAMLLISLVPSRVWPPCLWKAATNCIRRMGSQSQAGNALLLSPQGPVALWASPQGEGYYQAHFPGEGSRAHAGQPPAPGHQVQCGEQGPEPLRFLVCSSRSLKYRTGPLCQEAPCPTPIGRRSMLPSSGSQPDTRLARESQGLSPGRAGEQVCRVTRLLPGEACQATFGPAPTWLGPLPFYLLSKKKLYKVPWSTYPLSPSSPGSRPWQPLLHCDRGAQLESQVGH